MKKKLYINNLISLFYQFIAIVSGLIIPNLFLNKYGSLVYGLSTSMTQMLSSISLLDLGVGSVVQSTLYKPMAEKDDETIFRIYKSAQRYFKKVAYILIVYIAVLMFFYNYVNNSGFGFLFTATLLLSLSVSSFAQYYFGICNSLILNSDQKEYISLTINSLTLIFNIFISILLINLDFSIQFVKLTSSIIFLARPICLSYYVHHHYNFNFKDDGKDYLPNKWSGMFQHMSTVIANNIDIFVLTVFSSLANVSIYNIYAMPLNNLKSILISFTTGYKSYFGKILASDDYQLLYSSFNKFECFFHYIVTLIFSITINTIVPFVLVYTKGVTDVDYFNPAFAYWIVISYAVYVLRYPYTTIIFSAGHFKQTQMYSLIECILNIIISIYFVNRLGLIGVAIGTCVSVSFRILSSVYYLRNNILSRKYIRFIKLILLDSVCVGLILLLSSEIDFINYTYISWIIFALKVSVISLVTITAVFYVFNKDFLRFKWKRGE